MKFLKEVGFQPKDHISSSHLRAFASKSIDYNSPKRPEKDWKNFLSSRNSYNKRSHFELFRYSQILSNAPQRHICWCILKQGAKTAAPTLCSRNVAENFFTSNRANLEKPNEHENHIIKDFNTVTVEKYAFVCRIEFFPPKTKVNFQPINNYHRNSM